MSDLSVPVILCPVITSQVVIQEEETAYQAKCDNMCFLTRTVVGRKKWLIRADYEAIVEDERSELMCDGDGRKQHVGFWLQQLNQH